MKPFYTFSFLVLIAQNIAAQSFSLTVNEGYGDGVYQAGDTVEVWARAMSATEGFSHWSGYAGAGKEWHFSLVMPAEDVSLTANFNTIPANALTYEQIQGVDNLKKVYHYFPNNYRGVVFLFHGTNGSADSFVGQIENNQFIREAIADSFAVVISESEEVTLQNDLNADGGLRWNSLPFNANTNTDVLNIQAIIDTLAGRGLLDTNKPHFAVGMSNGGLFAPNIAYLLGWQAAISYCSQAAQNLFNSTTVPQKWNMAENDSQESVDNAQAEINYNTLINRGICAQFDNRPASPLYPERFARIGAISVATSQAIFDELNNNGVLDADNYLRFNSDSLLSLVLANPSNYPVYAAQTPQTIFHINDQVDACFAEHKFYSDYNQASLDFLKYYCNPPLTALQALEEASLRIYPNPASSIIYIESPISIESKRVIDMQGRCLVWEQNSDALVDISALPSGFYLVQIIGNQGVYSQKISINR